MQLIDDPPVTNPQPVAIPSLKLLDIVVPSIWIGGDLFDLLDNPILPRRRKPRQGLGERFRGHDGILPIVTQSNTLVKGRVSRVVGQFEFKLTHYR